MTEQVTLCEKCAKLDSPVNIRNLCYKCAEMVMKGIDDGIIKMIPIKIGNHEEHQ